jgi:hypothetical protein
MDSQTDPRIYITPGNNQPASVTTPDQAVPAPAPATGPAEPHTGFQLQDLTTPKEEVPFSLDEEGPASSPETIDKRTTKFKYGLGEILGKSRDEIFQGLNNGEEPSLREQAAAEIDRRKNEQLQTVLTTVAKNKGSNLTPDEISGLGQIVDSLSATTNPDTVLETAYGKQFIGTIDRMQMTDSNNPVSVAATVAPEHVAQMKDNASSLLAKREVLNTLGEDVEDNLKNQGWISWGADTAKGIVPGYEDVKLRGNVPGTNSLTGVGLGENLEAQRRVLYRLPVDQFKEQASAIVEKLKAANPQMAREWIEGMKGASDARTSSKI